MGKIINKVRQREFDAMLNHEALDRELRVAMCADNYTIAQQHFQALNQKMEKAGLVLPNQKQSG